MRQLEKYIPLAIVVVVLAGCRERLVSETGSVRDVSPPVGESPVAESPQSESPGPQPSRFQPSLARVRIVANEQDSRRVEVIVAWSPPEPAAHFARTLTLHHVDGNGGDATIAATPVLGTHVVRGGQLVFRPRFPLVPGERYRAVFHATPTVTETADYRVPHVADVPAPTLDAIYPTAPVLPANHLKFYLVFSEPMQQVDIFRHCQLVDRTTGDRVPRPFRHTQLWSADEKRLTLWFHPGRQKRGVNLNVEIGSILTAGHDYSLVISGDWKSQRGTPLGTDREKPFRAGTTVHAKIDPDSWKLTAPASTAQPLAVRFSRPLDWALLHSGFRVLDDDRPAALLGEWEAADHETVLRFRPKSGWQRGRTYRLVVATIVEDLAGNSIARPFEVDVQSRPAERDVPAESIEIPFQVSTVEQP